MVEKTNVSVSRIEALWHKTTRFILNRIVFRVRRSLTEKNKANNKFRKLRLVKEI